MSETIDAAEVAQHAHELVEADASRQPALLAWRKAGRVVEVLDRFAASVAR